MSYERTPLVAGLLGYGGLIPFAGLAVLSIIEPQHGVMYRGALLFYGAVILSFVGAVHWGVALLCSDLSDRERNEEYGLSVIPALIGWMTYLLMPFAAVLLLLLGFAFQYVVDIRSARRIPWPAWYLTLRKRLTTIASCCLVIGIAPMFFRSA